MNELQKIEERIGKLTQQLSLFRERRGQIWKMRRDEIAEERVQLIIKRNQLRAQQEGRTILPGCLKK